MAVNIPITNGKGSISIVPGTYDVTATADGYDASSLDPTSVTIESGIDDYAFTIAATGTLTLHVTDDGTEYGVQIVGATFQRCDSDGKTYGAVITTDGDGNAVFNYVPYSTSGTAPKVYFKQISSDEEHTFSAGLQNTTLNTETVTIQIENPDANEKNFTLTDKNYAGLPIADGIITLTSQ